MTCDFFESNLVAHQLTRIRLGKRKRSSSNTSDATISTSGSPSDTAMTTSDSSESDNVSDEASSSPPTTVQEEENDDYVEEAQSPRKKRRSCSPERNVEEPSFDVKMGESQSESTADAVAAVQEYPSSSVDIPIAVDHEDLGDTPADSSESQAAAPAPLSDLSPESSKAAATSDAPAPGSSMVDDVSESISQSALSSEVDTDSVDDIFAFQPPPTTTATSSPAWGSATKWGVKSPYTIPSAFASTSQSKSTTTISTGTPSPAWSSTTSWGAKPGPMIPSAFSASSTVQTNAFSAFTSSQTTSAFGVKRARDSDEAKPSPPAWRVFSGEDGSAGVLSSSVALGSKEESAQLEDALARPAHTPSSHDYTTGEEDENVLAEMKSVRLLVRHGHKEFADCGRGHIKLLSRKDDKKERLVFRREQVLKLGMNVRLRPTVRCTFSDEEGVLRVTLKEAKGVEKGEGTELVVYALKAGKSSIKELEEFSKMVTLSPHLSKK
ncbi:hypothetical protein OE88DRAFT_1733342 [Heliocybe sulcata]|uniref:RanBD1 domain-containing protein n=1 Tax=Heliocybe sulcata TaxID=5364 RepID=A0A5C3N8I4_9AGAM|nr:hypothetical protein OE88DRAFT_1733342 [Heliocybe sulcata]